MAENFVPMVRDGKVRPVAPEDIQAALGAGASIQGADESGMLPMQKDGKVRPVAPADIAAAFKAGASLLPLQAPEPAGPAVTPHAELPQGAPPPDDGAGGLTFMQGLSRYAGGDLVREGLNKLETAAQNKMIEHGLVTPDVARDYDMFQSREQVAQNIENHPTAAAFGEGVGIVGQALAPGLNVAKGITAAGTKAAGAASALAPKGMGLIARVARGGVKLAAQGAAEGALYGAAKEVDDAFLRDDYEGIAEKAMAGAEHGAETGAVVNATAGAAINLAAKGIKSLSGAWVGKADDAADQAAGGGWLKRVARSVLTTEDGAKQVIGNYREETDRVLGKLKTDLEQAQATGKADHALKVQERGAELERATRDLEDDFGKTIQGQKDAFQAMGQKRHTGLVTKINTWLRGAEEARNELDLPAKKEWLYRNATEPAPTSVAHVEQMFNLGAQDLDQLAENSAVKNGGDGALGQVKRLIKRFDGYREQASELEKAGKLNEGRLFILVDQMKRDVQGVVASSVNKREFLHDVLKPTADALEDFLENRGDWKPWSHAVAEMQERTNASWSKGIVSQSDSDLVKAFGELGEHDAFNAYRQPKKVRDSMVKALIDQSGQAEGAQTRQAFGNMLDAVSTDTAVRSRIYGSPAMAERADEMAKLSREILGTIDDAAKVQTEHTGRLAALEAEKQTAVDAVRNQYQEALYSLEQQHAGAMGAAKAGYEQAAGAAEQGFEQAAGNVEKRINKGAGLVLSTAAGAAGYAAGGPLGAVAAGAVAPVIRGVGARITQRLYPAAVSAQGAVNAASKLPGIIGNAVKATRTPAVKTSVDSALKQLDHLQKEQDPNTQEGQDHHSSLMQIQDELGPDMAQAIGAKYQAKTAFLLEKAGSPPLDMFGRPTRRDPVTALKLSRYVDAAENPVGALQRIGNGQGTSEDQETLQALYPQMYSEFAQKALENIDDSTPYPQRVKASLALGVPADRTMDPSYIAFTQGVVHSQAQQRAQPGGGGGGGKFDASAGMQTRSDRLSAKA